MLAMRLVSMRNVQGGMALRLHREKRRSMFRVLPVIVQKTLPAFSKSSKHFNFTKTAVRHDRALSCLVNINLKQTKMAEAHNTSSRKRKVHPETEETDECCYICGKYAIVYECVEGCGFVCQNHASLCGFRHNLCINCKPSRCAECRKRICCYCDDSSRCDICGSEWHDDCSLDDPFIACSKCRSRHCMSCATGMQETRCTSCYENLLKKRFVLSSTGRTISSLLPPLLEIVSTYIDEQR